MTPAGRLRALRRSPSLACSEPMALTGELKDHAVVDEPVYDDAGGHWVGEHLGPVRKGQVRRYSVSVFWGPSCARDAARSR